MQSIQITFRTSLSDPAVDPWFRYRGPVFHRWLPNGEMDALVIDLPGMAASIRLWFERRGYVDSGGFIQYAPDRREVDESVIPRQALLEAGVLFGRITLERVPDDEYEAVCNDETGSKAYVRFGKRVVTKILDPTLDSFVRTLRDTYGQHWIDRPLSFDSRSYSLGQYCHLLRMNWFTSCSEGKFIPDERSGASLVFHASRIPYEEYLDEAAWRRIGELLNGSHEPSSYLAITSRARRLLDEGRIEHAVVELVTALEIAIDEYLRFRLGGRKEFKVAANRFAQLSIASQVVVLAGLLGVNDRDVEATLNIIETRHKIVHEGERAPAATNDALVGTLNTLRQLSIGETPRFPPVFHGNELRANPKSWEEGES